MICTKCNSENYTVVIIKRWFVESLDDLDDPPRQIMFCLFCGEVKRGMNVRVREK